MVELLKLTEKLITDINILPVPHVVIPHARPLYLLKYFTTITFTDKYMNPNPVP